MNTVTIIKKEYEAMKAAYKQLKKLEDIILGEAVPAEEDVLRWSKEAKELKKRNKLPVLRSLKELRSL